jgi:hypothetical protein
MPPSFLVVGASILHAVEPPNHRLYASDAAFQKK